MVYWRGLCTHTAIIFSIPSVSPSTAHGTHDTHGALHGHSRFSHHTFGEEGMAAAEHHGIDGKSSSSGGSKSSKDVHPHAHLYGRSKRVLKQIVLRDQIGRNYTFYGGYVMGHCSLVAVKLAQPQVEHIVAKTTWTKPPIHSTDHQCFVKRKWSRRRVSWTRYDST